MNISETVRSFLLLGLLLLTPVASFLNPAPAPGVSDPAVNTPAPPSNPASYDIWVSYSEDSQFVVPRRVQENIEAGAAKWRSVITGSLPDFNSGGITETPSNSRFGSCPIPNGGIVDDLFICASAFYDSSSNALAAAGVVYAREAGAGGLPSIGVMTYNRFFLDQQTTADITNVLTHEMGHAVCISI